MAGGDVTGRCDRADPRPGPGGRYRADTGPERPNTNVFFYADDLEGTYAELSAKGVEFPAPPSRQPWGWWSTFVDSEGNRFALQQR
ncbi:VOC family protein [Saccharomonospora sp. CUA-673]|uniref:VOC family protein n=1 Tax=Saccharomonospora sp. CUA-673 TaxID=1904969 RepID=UPI000AB6DA26|nr:VOC family protein [Saccharomonospora sp. CUA-673]